MDEVYAHVENGRTSLRCGLAPPDGGWGYAVCVGVGLTFEEELRKNCKTEGQGKRETRSESTRKKESEREIEKESERERTEKRSKIQNRIKVVM
ncbi:hypothetical protein EVAR_99112_1 [Eumeta japonica]|uniref:Uncharacterized protein n=1 Tax=Eumeta variegata TaxID=151549 RepID=A0A4C1Z107_EUMVA|nr:hypothetical protein EVAR_99112_1 [Eumeta japonica]